MTTMKWIVPVFASFVILAAAPASAQAPQIPNPTPPVPQPPPPPPPSLAVPPVPKMDAPPAPAPAPRVDRRSFNQRFNACQGDAVAAGLDVGERASYARACAQQL